ncbi:MAG: MarR family transcriptional regulator [Pseudomonadota bacterium]
MKPARLDDQLCFALYSASNRLTNIYRPILEPLGLTYTQFVTLMALWEADDVSISQLAQSTGLSKPTMTPLLKRLQEKDLIQLQRVAGNDRQKSVVLTRKGRALASKSLPATEAAFCATGLTKRQATEMIKLCNQIAADGP